MVEVRKDQPAAPTEAEKDQVPETGGQQAQEPLGRMGKQPAG
jgi:hypothetical protein